MTIKAGFKGACYIGGTKIGGANSWTYGGETRNMADIDEFTAPIVKQLPLQLVGGDIAINANYLLAEDDGQKLLKTKLDSGAEFDDLRLYTDYDAGIYLTPKAGSGVIVTNANNVGDTSSGTGTNTATIHVNGSLEQIGSTTAVAVETLGEVDVTASAVTLWGKLLNRGGEAGDLDCYFEYGTTLSFGDNTKASETVFATPDLGEYDDESLAALDGTTEYFYRAVCELADTSKVYGRTMSFTTA